MEMTIKKYLTKPEEIFKPIKGFEGLYEVSSLGRIYSVRRSRFLSLWKNKDGYLKCTIREKQRMYQFFVHRVVSEHFIPNLDGKPEVNHKNGIKVDNRIENLEWCTRLENIRHSWQLGLSKYNPKTKEPCIKAHEIAVVCVETGKRYDSLAKASEHIGVSRGLMSVCCQNKNRTAKGLHFRKLTPAEIAEITGYKVEEK